MLPPDALAPAEAPTDEAGVIDAVREAVARRAPLHIEGRGTKRPMLRPVQAARSLSCRALCGITLHAPTELVVAARAGTPLDEIEAVLAGGRQMLLSEPPDLTALLGTAGVQTLGGLVAANLSGPRRIAWGATRDHVMGVRAVNGSGELIRSGGRVLKNVTGLDLCKLLAGSHGTLGILTEVTLKVLPAPERTGSLLLRGLSPVLGVAALAKALGSPFGVTGAAYLPAEAAARVNGLGQGAVALMRIEDFAPSVAYRLGRLAESFEGAELLEHAASQAAWRAVRDAVPLRAEAGEAVWRVSVRPSAGPGVLAAVQEAGGRGFLDWGGGLVWAAGPEGAHDDVSAAARAARGVWMLMRGSDAMRTAVAVVPPEPAPLARIAARVKQAMDPAGVLNPGRFGPAALGA